MGRTYSWHARQPFTEDEVAKMKLSHQQYPRAENDLRVMRLIATVDALRAEVERLRGLLTDARGWCYAGEYNDHRAADALRDRIDAALKAAQKGGSHAD